MKAVQESKRVGLVLCGCGAWDGTDIHETVLTMLALERAGATVVCAAPDMRQLHVLNHQSIEEMDETRQVTIETARLARGDVIDLKALSGDDLDAVILPGGHGAIKQLSQFAIQGPRTTVNAELQRLLDEMARAQKPIGAISAAAITLVRALHSSRPRVTIGNDQATATALKTMGGRHQARKADQIHIDRQNLIITTPGYMASSRITQVAVGIEKLVQTVLAMTVDHRRPS